MPEDALGRAGAVDVERAAELVARLVEIESVNPELDPNGSGEAELARYVGGWLEERGLEVLVEEPAPGRANVIARRPGTGGGRTLLLNGHLDTVALTGEWAGLEPRREGDRLYGRGSVDMKGGVAAIMLALEDLAGAELAGDVIVGAVADEEARSVGASALVERVEADAAVVTEPTDLDMVVAHKGFAWYTVSTTGRAAHGSLPEEGHDAILDMTGALAAVAELSAELGDGERHPLLGPGSVHASTVAGGVEWSTYPAACELRVERRTLPGEDRARLEAELARLVAGAANDGAPAPPEGSIELVREPFAVDAGEDVVVLLRDAAEAVRGARPEQVGFAAWTDAALIAASGVPTVVFGPGGVGAHAAREWVELPEVELCARALVGLATEFCA